MVHEFRQGRGTFQRNVGSLFGGTVYVDVSFPQARSNVAKMCPGSNNDHNDH